MDDPTLQAFADALREELGPDLVAAALFGSRARGDACSSSDWDVFVIVAHEPCDSLGLLARLRTACALRAFVSPTLMVRGRAAFEAAFPSIYLDIAADGVVFAGAEYLEPRLSRIREITAAAGLHRVRRDGGFAWEWARRPKGHWALDWDGYRDVA